ncbi:hypothetical protein M413DRAFT_209580 [Hebeloma cylindrosporum]|uniref:RRM domain-containing protein n=1 Tax=Hebeloma cylindrosporum TaxID=76867 RepID=A0A0C3CUJ6_HEBCY|nr:hypothetical protein M413DRAFT_209580 [Hebeloma cylindrosporum h7]
MTEMTSDDQPYTTAEEDPFQIQPFILPVKAVKSRRSSMLDKWIIEQQAQSSQPMPLVPYSGLSASASNPYLAYPDLPRVSSERAQPKQDDDTQSITSYDLVDDDDIPTRTMQEDSTQQEPVTPIPPRTHKSSRHSLTPSFRTLNLNFLNNSPPTPSSPNMEAAARAFNRLSFFPRTPRSSTEPSSVINAPTPPRHSRSTSLSTPTISSSHKAASNIPSSTSSKWRPSVLGHFHQPSASQISIGISEAQYTPSRPSISSGDTYATSSTSRTTTTFDSNIPSTPSKLSLFDSIRLRGNKSLKAASNYSRASTSSVQLSSPTQEESPPSSYHPKASISQRSVFAPKPGSVLDNLEDDEEDLEPPPTYRFSKHASSRPSIPFSSSGTMPRVKFSSLNSRSHRKKKKLVISGIGVTEVRKLEGIRRWCESFGDVRNMMRMPNGDLHVDFRDPDVADTVCRVRAKVFIAGVGSVQLSWIAGNKR